MALCYKIKFTRKRMKKWNGLLSNSPKDAQLPQVLNVTGSEIMCESHHRIVIIAFRWKTIGTRKWGKRAKMIAVSLFIWTLISSRDRTEIGLESRRDSRRDSLYSRDDRDRADSRRNSRETATVALAIIDRRRHRPRRHSRRYYIERKRWVVCRELAEFDKILNDKNCVAQSESD